MPLNEVWGLQAVDINILYVHLVSYSVIWDSPLFFEPGPSSLYVDTWAIQIKCWHFDLSLDILFEAGLKFMWSCC